MTMIASDGPNAPRCVGCGGTSSEHTLIALTHGHTNPHPFTVNRIQIGYTTSGEAWCLYDPVDDPGADSPLIEFRTGHGNTDLVERMLDALTEKAMES